MSICPVCLSTATIPGSTGDFSLVECTVCGTYKISGTALAMLTPRLTDLDRASISEQIQKLERQPGEPPLIDSTKITRMIAATSDKGASTTPD